MEAENIAFKPKLFPKFEHKKDFAIEFFIDWWEYLCLVWKIIFNNCQLWIEDRGRFDLFWKLCAHKKHIYTYIYILYWKLIIIGACVHIALVSCFTCYIYGHNIVKKSNQSTRIFFGFPFIICIIVDSQWMCKILFLVQLESICAELEKKIWALHCSS